MNYFCSFKGKIWFAVNSLHCYISEFLDQLFMILSQEIIKASRIKK